MGRAYVMGHPLSGSGLYDVSRKLTVRALGMCFQGFVGPTSTVTVPAPVLHAEPA